MIALGGNMDCVNWDIPWIDFTTVDMHAVQHCTWNFNYLNNKKKSFFIGTYCFFFCKRFKKTQLDYYKLMSG